MLNKVSICTKQPLLSLLLLDAAIFMNIFFHCLVGKACFCALLALLSPTLVVSAHPFFFMHPCVCMLFNLILSSAEPQVDIQPSYILAAPALIYACDIKGEVIFHFHLLELGNEPKHQGASTSSTTPYPGSYSWPPWPPAL